MEAFLHRLFTAKSDFPVWVRYLLTLGLVGLAFLARVMADEYLRSYPLLLFIPAIFLSSVLFGRGCGIVATAAAAVLAMTYLISRPASTAGGRSAPGARTSNAERPRYHRLYPPAAGSLRNRPGRAEGDCVRGKPGGRRKGSRPAARDGGHQPDRAGAGHRVLMRQPCGFSPGRAHDLDPGPLRGHLGEEFAGGLDRADRQRTASSTHFRRAATARWRSSCGPRKPTFWCR
ncbi:hypothetical protein ACVIQY_001959 [Bradyrhizobium sp. USDA 3051]